MGDELQKNLDAEIELIAGAGGIFDVKADGRLIFSKFEQGRFPRDAEEVISRIRQD